MNLKPTAATLFSLLAGQALAVERDPAYKASAFHMVTAHECAKITGDQSRVDKAVQKSRARLHAAGYSNERSESALAEIMAGFSDQKREITSKLCDDLLTNLER